MPVITLKAEVQTQKSVPRERRFLSLDFSSSMETNFLRESITSVLLKVSMKAQMDKNFRSFCEFTSLHGWHYMVESSRSTVKKIFWGLILMFSLAAASFFLYANTWVRKFFVKKI